MERVFIPIGPFQNILNNIANWKVIGLRKLFEMELYNLTYQGFAKQVKQLEQEGLVASFRGKDRTKYLYLTSRGSKVTSVGTSFELSDETLTHDLICSNVLLELLKYKNFVSANVMHDAGKLLIEPDGIIYAIKKNREYTCALEVELHQKSRDRIKAKFAKYSNSSIYTHVLYVTNKMSLIRFYNTILEQMNSDIENKIVLLLDEDLSATNFNYQKSKCWFKGEERSFVSIFGE